MRKILILIFISPFLFLSCSLVTLGLEVNDSSELSDQATHIGVVKTDEAIFNKSISDNDDCYVFQNESNCEEEIVDFCLEHSEESLCIKEEKFLADSEIDFCNEFSDDKLCIEDDLLIYSELNDILADRWQNNENDDYIDGFCIKFPDYPTCG